jgi:hypothetical protein
MEEICVKKRKTENENIKYCNFILVRRFVCEERKWIKYYFNCIHYLIHVRLLLYAIIISTSYNSLKSLTSCVMFIYVYSYLIMANFRLLGEIIKEFYCPVSYYEISRQRKSSTV